MDKPSKNTYIDNLISTRNKLDLEFDFVLDDLKDLPTDPTDDYKTIYHDSVLHTINKLRDIVIQIKTIDSMIDTYKSTLN
jgi:hypothetical protein